MTDRRKSPKRSLRRTTMKVAALASVLFVAIFAGLSLQLAAGKDPALGGKANLQANVARPVIVRKVIKRTVIVRKIEKAPAAPQRLASSSQPVTPVQSQSPSPTYTPPAAAAPAPAPAPAQAPAPVVSKVS